MAGGTLTITVDAYAQLEPVAQRILCWAAADVRRVGIRSGAVPGVVIPEEIIAGKGTLLLKRAGSDLVAAPPVGTHLFTSGGNGLHVSQNPNSCPSSAVQPTVTSVTITGATSISLVYANVLLAGTVNIFWGDGSSDLGEAESGTIAHTYTGPGTWRIRIEDASTPANFGETIAAIPPVA